MFCKYARKVRTLQVIDIDILLTWQSREAKNGELLGAYHKLQTKMYSALVVLLVATTTTQETVQGMHLKRGGGHVHSAAVPLQLLYALGVALTLKCTFLSEHPLLILTK